MGQGIMLNTIRESPGISFLKSSGNPAVTVTIAWIEGTLRLRKLEGRDVLNREM